MFALRLFQLFLLSDAVPAGQAGTGEIGWFLDDLERLARAWLKNGKYFY